MALAVGLSGSAVQTSRACPLPAAISNAISDFPSARAAAGGLSAS
jgi:hypothetical protein